MNEVTITCNRCGKVVHGVCSETPQGKMTGGYYDVSEGYWAQFARWEETEICDDCMFADPKYAKLYGSSPRKLPPLFEK